MSIHGTRSKSRHPDAPRDLLQVGHICFEFSEEHGSFALIAGQAVDAKNRRPLFTGFVSKGMARQLREIAHRFDQIEAGLADDTK